MDILRSKRVLLLDGGFSNELEARVSYDVHAEPLWTAKALHTDGVAVTDTHLAFLEAGCDIIETATYQATIEGIRTYLHLNDEMGQKLFGDGVAFAKDAVRRYHKCQQRDDGTSIVEDKPVLIAGSIGPYGVYLRDGSEYTGSYMSTVTREQMETMHRFRIAALVSGGADIIAVETMPALREVEIILNVMANGFPNTKVWVSMSVKEHNASLTAAGDSIEETYRVVSKFPQVVAFGINCCKPTDVSDFLKIIQKLRTDQANMGQESGENLKLIVYPNTGQDWVRGKGWIKTPVPSLDTYVAEWIHLGANIIGGCCQVGAGEIAKMRRVIDEYNIQKE